MSITLNNSRDLLWYTFQELLMITCTQNIKYCPAKDSTWHRTSDSNRSCNLRYSDKSITKRPKLDIVIIQCIWILEISESERKNDPCHKNRVIWKYCQWLGYSKCQLLNSILDERLHFGWWEEKMFIICRDTKL